MAKVDITKVAMVDLSYLEDCYLINPVATHPNIMAMVDISSVEACILCNLVPPDLNLVEGIVVLVL